MHLFNRYNRHPQQIPYIKYKETCLQCVCRMGGNEECAPMTCDIDCPAGQVVERTATCNCTCKSCKTDEAYCPTTKVCIDKSKWCDGVADCDDDEKDCVTTAVTTPSTELTTLTTPGEYKLS